MYPEVEQFIAALNAASDEENKAYEAAWDDFIDKRREAGLENARHASDACPRCEFDDSPAATERREAIRAGADALQEAEAAAWDALTASSDPLVAWIAENCRAVADEATQVLIALPASMEDLDTMARDMGWCGIWREFREQAEQDGVLPSQSEVPAA